MAAKHLVSWTGLLLTAMSLLSLIMLWVEPRVVARYTLISMYNAKTVSDTPALLSDPSDCAIICFRARIDALPVVFKVGFCPREDKVKLSELLVPRKQGDEVLMAVVTELHEHLGLVVEILSVP